MVYRVGPPLGYSHSNGFQWFAGWVGADSQWRETHCSGWWGVVVGPLLVAVRKGLTETVLPPPPLRAPSEPTLHR